MFQALAQQVAQLEIGNVLQNRLINSQPCPEVAHVFEAVAVNISRGVSWMGTEIWSGDVTIIEESASTAKGFLC